MWVGGKMEREGGTKTVYCQEGRIKITVVRVPAFCPLQALGKDAVCSDCPWECGELSRGILGKRCLHSCGRGKGYFKKHPWGLWIPLFPVASCKDSSVSYLKFLWLPGVLSGVLSRTELQKPPHLIKIPKYETSYSEDKGHWWCCLGQCYSNLRQCHC